MRGNVVDLAVAVVIGAAFGAVVNRLRRRHPDADHRGDLRPAGLLGSSFTINGSVFQYGLFINALISFLLIAAAIYYVVVVPMNKLAERRARGADPTVKECPECLSEIPHKARKCAFCGSEQHDAAAGAPAVVRARTRREAGGGRPSRQARPPVVVSGLARR